MEDKLHLLPEAQDVSRFQGARSGDALAVDKGAVGAAEILDNVPAPAPDNASVLARHPGVLHLNVALIVAADGDRRRTDFETLPGTRASGYSQGGCWLMGV